MITESAMFLFFTFLNPCKRKLIPLTPKSDQGRLSPCNINTKSNKTSHESKEKCKAGDYQLIQFQILQVNIKELIDRQ